MKTTVRLFNKDCFYHINYAHRGLHDNKAGIPENSIAAFKLAVENGYGVELDVQLSKDGQVVVFHDDTLDRVCDVHGNVCDFDYSDLSQMRLLNTDETITLFSDVLEILKNGAGPLIVELKNGNRNAELCEKTLRLLNDYPRIFCIESFNPLIVNWFRKNAPQVFRGQLSQPAKEYPSSFGKPVIWILSGCRLSFLNKPDFIAYKIGPRPTRILRKNKKGVLLFGWTSRTPVKDTLDNDGVIFEGYKPELTF